MHNLFSAGAMFDFGTVIFTEEDIIDFARRNDPLDFHLDKEHAEAHFFKKLVASGQHAFHHFYVHHWIPRFGSTVLCGLSVENWKFLKPMYAGQPIHCILRINSVIGHEGRSTLTVKWLFEFLNEEGFHFQQLEMSVLHRSQPALK